MPSFKNRQPATLTRTNVGHIQAFIRGFDIPATTDGGTLASPYQQHVAVFRCINTIVNSIARLKYVLFRRNTVLKSGPVYDLMRNPNPLMSWSDFISFLNTQLHVCGNFWALIDEPNSQGVPRALLPLPPKQMRPVRGPGLGELLGWELVTTSGKPIPLGINEVLHIKYAHHPFDMVMGISPMDAVRVAINTDTAAAVYNESMLKTGGWPAGVLSYRGGGVLTEEMRNEVRAEYQRYFGGPSNAAKIAVINKDWGWQQTGTSSRDMEFSDSRKWNLADISRAFNVPLMFLNEQEKSGLGDAGLRIEMKRFYYETVIPLAHKLEDVLNDKLYPLIDSSVQGVFDFTQVEALWDDYHQKVESAEKLAKMGFSANNINRNLGLKMDEEEWGDDHLSVANMVPDRDIVNHTVSLPGKATDNATTGNLIDDSETQKPLQVEDKTAGVRDTLWLDHSRDIEAILTKCQRKLQRYIMSQRSRVIRGGELINPKEVAETIIPYVVDAYRLGFDFCQPSKYDSLYAAGNYGKEQYKLLVRFGEKLNEILETVSDASEKPGVLNRFGRKSDVLLRSPIFTAFNRGAIAAARKVGSLEYRWITNRKSKCGHETMHLQVKLINAGKHPGELRAADCDCIVLPVLSSKFLASS